MKISEEFEKCGVHEATHVRVVGESKIREIASKHGVFPGGGLAKPSQGGFGVTTTDGRSVGMWRADAYCRKNS